MADAIFRGANALAEEDLDPLLQLSQPRAGDVRALAGAILLGSAFGAAIGGAYLLGVVGRGSARAVQAVALLAAPEPSSGRASGRSPPTVSASSAPSGGAWALRARFALQSASSLAERAVGAGRGGDLTCLTQVIYYEARGEPAAGQAAVAQVVINRVRHPAFPKTICGVAHQRSGDDCQFTFACRRPAADPVDAGAWRRARQVALQALRGSVMRGVGEATHFQTARSGPFAGLLRVAQVGAHVFYRFAGRSEAAERSRPVQVAAAQPNAPAALSVAAAVLPPGPAATPPAAAGYKVIDASAAVAVEHAPRSPGPSRAPGPLPAPTPAAQAAASPLPVPPVLARAS